MLRLALLFASAFSAYAVLAETATPVNPPADDGLGALPTEPRGPLGDIAGNRSGDLPEIVNPVDATADAVVRGQQLYIKMNCAGCHGYDAKGGMGPNLTDHYWRYGGSPLAIYQSIVEGRPQGMPAWGAAIPRDQIWSMVAYIQSLGGAFAAKDAAAQREGDRPGDLVAPEMAGKP